MAQTTVLGLGFPPVEESRESRKAGERAREEEG